MPSASGVSPSHTPSSSTCSPLSPLPQASLPLILHHPQPVVLPQAVVHLVPDVVAVVPEDIDIIIVTLFSLDMKISGVILLPWLELHSFHLLGGHGHHAGSAPVREPNHGVKSCLRVLHGGDRVRALSCSVTELTDPVVTHPESSLKEVNQASISL